MFFPVVQTLTRAMLVPAASEFRCEDSSCSRDGTCPPRMQSLSQNRAPKLQLLPVVSQTVSGEVLVPRGWEYKLCEPGVVATVDRPCETGTPRTLQLIHNVATIMPACFLPATAFARQSDACAHALEVQSHLYVCRLHRL